MSNVTQESGLLKEVYLKKKKKTWFTSSTFDWLPWFSLQPKTYLTINYPEVSRLVFIFFFYGIGEKFIVVAC